MQLIFSFSRSISFLYWELQRQAKLYSRALDQFPLAKVQQEFAYSSFRPQGKLMRRYLELHV
jgi:hypothetical protein